MEAAVALGVNSSVNVPGCLEEVTLLGARTVDLQWWRLRPTRWSRR
jgi:hypothetical protein